MISGIADMNVVNLVGLSTDTKPTEGIINGSTFLEMDTDTKYMFDQDNGTWHPITK